MRWGDGQHRGVTMQNGSANRIVVIETALFEAHESGKAFEHCFARVHLFDDRARGLGTVVRRGEVGVGRAMLEVNDAMMMAAHDMADENEVSHQVKVYHSEDDQEPDGRVVDLPFHEEHGIKSQYIVEDHFDDPSK